MGTTNILCSKNNSKNQSTPKKMKIEMYYVLKASGSDMIPARILRDMADEMAPVLTVIFQRTLTLGDIPDD